MTRPEVEARLRDAATVDDRLDEVRRARMWGELSRRLDAAGPGRRRRGVIVAAVLAAAIAAAVLLAVGARALWGGGQGGGALSRATQVLEVPASATARAQLGAAAVTLHGPARMQVERADRVVEVVLEAGAVSGEYDGAKGGRMRVRTPHAIVEVVGTLFDVEVEDGATCVAVAHGKVRVRAGRVVRLVGDGESWCTDAGEVRAVLPAAEERMRAVGVTVVHAEPKSEPEPQPQPEPEPQPQPPPQPPRLPAPEVDAGAVTEPEPEPEVVSPPDVALYEEAERALRLGDTALADELLARLVVNHGSSELVDDAIFERARLAYARGAWAAARASLDQLLAMPSTPLREPARAMLCRIAERTGDRDAKRCFDALQREEVP